MRFIKMHFYDQKVFIIKTFFIVLITYMTKKNYE